MGILSVDFGGTRTRAGWFDNQLILEQRTETPSRTEDAPDVVIQRIIDTARQVVPADEEIEAIGISAPGPQAYNGIIIHAHTLPGWHNVALASIISSAFGCTPTFMQNDANLAAVAEYHTGAGRGANPVVYMTVSTGIGGGAIIDGKLFTGHAMLAIEPGHQKFLLPDGKIYSLEQLASGTAIGHIARQKLEISKEASMLRTVENINGQAVGNAAAAGDAFALEIIQEAGRWMGMGLVNLIHFFNPQVIVLGGSVIQLGDLILNPARRVIEENILDPAFLHPDLIRKAQLGDDVCLVGAAFHARTSLDAISG
jgi:glucokinase